MEGSAEPIAVRIARLNNIILGKNLNQTQNQQNTGKLLAREGLLDAVTLLYDECNNETMRRDKNVVKFIDKCE